MALKHVVFIKFKDDIREEEISKLEELLGKLPDVIPEIKLYEFGRDVIRSERSYDFALISEFENLESLSSYQKHPEHVKVLELVKEIAESIVAVDFYN